jgi:hypothetical protein
MKRFPFGDRLLAEIPALSFSPGHTPTHEARLFGRKRSGCSTHFGDDLMRRIHSQAGQRSQTLHRILMWAQ